MNEILQTIFHSFWTFIGTAILFGMSIDLVRFLWNRPFRHANIRKHGWPPPHCDADGDAVESDKEES